MEARRAELRAAHRAHVLSGHDGRVRVLTGSALTEDETEDAIGNFGVLEAADRRAALAFAEADPYARGGLVAGIEIIALAASFQAHRIDPMTPSTPERQGGSEVGRPPVSPNGLRVFGQRE